MNVAAEQNRTSGILTEIWTEVNELYGNLDPMAQKFLFEIPVRAGERQQTPMVLILGNHSAGKSTFINHLIGRNVQATGVAPTDDGFTILLEGQRDDVRDGQTLVGTPEYGFAELSRFGSGLLSYLRMKTVADAPILHNMMLVDSPGMIDSHETARRNYDFEGVVQWLGERADVILLLFDPDKPGTTGETLRVLITSLKGLEHKLMIVLNKVDMFDNVHDFARAYGTLCWNLAKVVTSKDIPLIFNSYVPVQNVQQAPSPIALEPFDRSREEVIREIRRAPERRVDNTVTKLHQHARQLLAHTEVCREVNRRTQNVMWRWRGHAVLAMVVAVVAGFIFKAYHWPNAYAVGAVVVGVILSIGFIKLGEWLRQDEGKTCLDDLGGIFDGLHRHELDVADQGDLRDLWGSIKVRTRRALETLGVDEVPYVWAGERQRIMDIIEKRVPELRSRIHTRRLKS